MENGSFQFDPQTFRPTYRFIPGLPGSSNALEIAARLGFPETLQRKARMELGDSRLKLDKLISQLKDQLQTLEEQKEKLGKQKNSLARLKREYLAVVVTEKEENEKNRKELQRRVADFISCSRDELKAALHEMEAGLEEEQINDAPFQKALSRVYADAGRLDLIPELLLRRNGELHKGDAVYIPHLSLRGTLLEDPSKSESVHISCEGKSVRVPVAELLPDKNAKPTQVDNSANRINYEIHTERENPLKSVNIIGKTVDEAIPIVEKALDAALLWEDSSLTIIHGAGTGKLKDAVEKLINNHPSVCGFSSAPRQEGGGGVTVVEL
jgi:DNA mismatch repair protein MutS2